MKIQFEQTLASEHIRTEDSGCAKIADLYDPNAEPAEEEYEGEGVAEADVALTLTSWSDHGQHDVFDQFIGKKIRVTVEVI